MSDLALIIFAGIVVALYLVSDHMSSKPRVNETEREIIERMMGQNKVALDLDCALMMACDRLGQYGGCPKCDRYSASDSFIENCEWVSDTNGRRYCSYAKCWRKHLMELSLRSKDKQ